jgi:hypothetical protein
MVLAAVFIDAVEEISRVMALSTPCPARTQKAAV